MPLGLLGLGEVGITGVAAAIANAVHHATGRRVRDLPITLDKLHLSPGRTLLCECGNAMFTAPFPRHPDRHASIPAVIGGPREHSGGIRAVRFRDGRQRSDGMGAGHSAALVLIIDTRPRVLLRRDGPGQERARHDDAELHRDGHSSAVIRVGRSPIPSPSRLRGRQLIGDLDFAGHDGTWTRRYRASRRRGTGDTAARSTWVFQMMFAVITPGAHHGRDRRALEFGSLRALHRAVVAARVRAGRALGVSPGGWAAELGALDFAGGTVVHINAGAAAWRWRSCSASGAGWPKEPMRPNNVPFTLLGAAHPLVRLVRVQRGLGARRDGLAA